MLSEDLIRSQLDNTLNELDLPQLSANVYIGKVRNNYIDDEQEIRTMICTDRLSAFDRVITTIPFKGQLLNQMAAFWFEKTKHIAKNHIIDMPDPNVIRAYNCQPYPIEMVVRAYITGSAWRAYEKGKAVSGIQFPEGLKKNQKLDAPVITPTTKEDTGHDQPISREEIMDQGIVDLAEYEQLEEKALQMFDFASNYCAQNNLILVDCKFEFGRNKDGEILVIDEIFTPDASRFWILDTYEEKFMNDEEPDILDKEFFRTWLSTECGFTGDGEIPEVPDNVKVEFVNRYVQSFEMITGQTFRACY